METPFRISEQDYVKALKLSIKPTQKALLYSAISLLVLIGLPLLFGPMAFFGAVVAGLLTGVCLILLMYYAIFPLSSKRHYQKYKAIQQQMSVELSDEGLSFTSSLGQGMTTWDNFIKWRHDGDYILLYIAPRLYYIVPKRLAADDFDISLLIARLTRELGQAK